MRDLCRARTDAVQDLRRGRAQLKAFLLRNGYRYTGRSAWSEAHRRYLRELVLPHAAQRVVLEDALANISLAGERIMRLEEQMEALLESWAMKPVARALMGMRGFAVVGAMVLASELGGAWRFAHPGQLMAYLGLVPSESTSSEKRRQGGITKAGNSHARWLLIEAAHHYRLSPKISKELSLRQRGLGEEVKAVSWKAQTRLHKRTVQLSARGKQKNKVTVAVARELCGFVWHIFVLMGPVVARGAAAPPQLNGKPGKEAV
jgi:transposase